MTTLKHYTKTLNTLCYPSLPSFLDDFTKKLLIKLDAPISCDSGAFDVKKKIAVFQSLHDNIISLENNILAVAGYGSQIEMLHNALHQVTHVVTCLEELQYYCLEDSEMLKEEYANGHLCFQNWRR